MHVIDSHSHFLPPSYMKSLRGGKGKIKIVKDAMGQEIQEYDGDYNIILQGHWDLDFRREVFQKNGIDAQFISLTVPGIHIEERGYAIEQARMINEDFGTIDKDYAGIYYSLATLPLQDVETSVQELDYAVKTLHLKGAMVFSNVAGHYLDEPQFEPLLAKAVELGVPLVIHPAAPAPTGKYADYRLVATVGFPIDTTLCVARMIFAGTFDRFPDLKIVTGHLGGALPFLAERMDRCMIFPENAHLKQTPSWYLRHNVYYDGVAFEPKMLAFAIDYLGADRLLLGSDYPHQIGSIEKCARVLDGLNVSDEVKARIAASNVQQLFHIG